MMQQRNMHIDHILPSNMQQYQSAEIPKYLEELDNQGFVIDSIETICRRVLHVTFRRLIKMGFTINIINRLEQDGQLENVMFDANGNVSTNDAFETYRQGIDDFYRFELSKFI